VSACLIWKYAFQGKAYTRVKFKASSLGTPLSWSSSHPQHVHMGWPVSTLKSARALCSTSASMLTAGNTLIQRFKSHNADEVLITILSDLLHHLIRSRNSRGLPEKKVSTPKEVNSTVGCATISEIMGSCSAISVDFKMAEWHGKHENISTCWH
jgi:hypothetical protein